MSRSDRAQTDRTQQRTSSPRLRGGRCASLAPMRVIDVLSGVLISMQPMRRCARRLRAFAPRLTPHSALHGLTGFPRVLAHVRVRPHVQTACPESLMPMAWTALAGRSAAPCAAPPRHRLPVPSGRGKMQGKIEGSGTLPAHERVCTWGWRSTRHWTAPCRRVRQSLMGIGQTTCMARPGAMALTEATP